MTSRESHDGHPRPDGQFAGKSRRRHQQRLGPPGEGKTGSAAEALELWRAPNAAGSPQPDESRLASQLISPQAIRNPCESKLVLNDSALAKRRCSETPTPLEARQQKSLD